MPSFATAAAGAGLLVAWQVSPTSACTIVGVAAEASATGFPILAHTGDSGPMTDDLRWVRVPRRKWPEGSMRPLYHWDGFYPRVVSASLGPDYEPIGDQKLSEPIGFIPQVPETYAYWDLDYGTQNEAGLSISESTATGKTVGWPATPDKPYGYCRAGIEDLSKLALERCATARCAVQLMGDIAVEQGFYSADSGPPTKPDHADSAEALAVADLQDIWIFNVLTGPQNASAIWAAMRIPRDHVVAVGNSHTIRKMNLNDPENFLYSPGVWKHAEEMGWWSPANDAPGIFDFFGSYGFTPGGTADVAKDQLTRDLLSFYSGRRMWRIFSLLSPAEGAKLNPNHGNLPNTPDPYPASVPAPKGSITAADVMEVLRDHLEGTPYDLTAGMAAGPFGSPNRGARQPLGTVGMWERAISLHRTHWSFVLEPRANGRSVAWFGQDSPHGTAYLPFFAAGGRAPDCFCSHVGNMSTFSTNQAYWAFNLVNQYSDLNFKLINADVRVHSKKIEDEGRQKVVECNAEADHAAIEGGEDAARHALTQCSNRFVEDKVEQWWQLAWSLIAKYRSYTITSNESSNGVALQEYPMWWVSSMEVGFTDWTPWGPFHGILFARPDFPGTALGALSKLSQVVPVSVALAAVVASYQIGLRRGRRACHEDGQGFYVAAP